MLTGKFCLSVNSCYWLHSSTSVLTALEDSLTSCLVGQLRSHRAGLSSPSDLLFEMPVNCCSFWMLQEYTLLMSSTGCRFISSERRALAVVTIEKHQVSSRVCAKHTCRVCRESKLLSCALLLNDLVLQEIGKHINVPNWRKQTTRNPQNLFALRNRFYFHTFHPPLTPVVLFLKCPLRSCRGTGPAGAVLFLFPLSVCSQGRQNIFHRWAGFILSLVQNLSSSLLGKPWYWKAGGGYKDIWIFHICDVHI